MASPKQLTSLAMVAILATASGARADDLRSQEDPRVATSDVVSTGDEVWLQVGSLFGRVLDLTPEVVYVELAGHPGSRVGVERDLVDPTIIYQVKLRDMDRSDPKAWLRLASFAREHDLHSLRIDALQNSLALDPSSSADIEERMAHALTECTKARLARAEELEEAGETRRAIRHLQDTLSHYENCEATKKVRATLARLEREVRKEKKKQVMEQEGRRWKEGWAHLEDATDLIEEGGRYLTDARRELDDSVRAARRIQRSVALLKAAEESLDQVASDLTSDFSDLEAEGYALADVRKEKNRLRLVVQDDLLEARTELGHLYIARGDLQSAQKQVGLAAMIDSSDWRVRLLRSSIASAAGERDRTFRRRR